jgi:Raf kinase inhibitor-like YbhB/YbcL family protein
MKIPSQEVHLFIYNANKDEEVTMPKHIISLILIGCLVILAGCAPAPEPTEPPEPAQEEAAVEEVIPTDTPLPPTEETEAEDTEEEETSAEEEGEPAMEMTITSPAFIEGDPIPVQFSCDGEDISPELAWSGIPEGTASLAFIMDDPDAPMGTWVHWVLFNLPADSTGLPQAVTGVGVDGQNSWDRTGYGGPCPPGGTHRYYFKLYALDTILDLDPGANKAALESAMEGHILAQAELMGTYSR